MASDRHDLALRDVRDGQLVVSLTRVRHGHSSTRASHVSDRLPLACLALFDGPTVDVASLTEEERAWIEAEGNRIEFGSEPDRQTPKQRVVTDGGVDQPEHEFVFYVYEDDAEDPRFSFWIETEDASGMSLYERPPDGEGKWLKPSQGSDHGAVEPSKDLRRVLADVMDCGVDAERVHDLPPHERHFVQIVHGTVDQRPQALPGPVYGFLHDCAEEFGVEPDVATDGGHPPGEHPGSVCADCVAPGPDHTLEFADEYVLDIEAGAKTATVRYGADGSGIERGDTVELVDESGASIQTVDITRTAACYAIEAWETIQVWGAGYGADSPSETVSGVNQHYDAPIRPLTDVRVLAWRAPEVDDAE